MTYFFLEVPGELEIKIPKEIKNKKVGILFSVQFSHLAEKIKSELKSSIIGGQVVGCNAINAIKIADKVDCFYLISEGRFHALEIARKTKKPVYIATGDKITKEEITNYEKKLIAKKSKYYLSQNLGILVSLKPGQYNLNQALKIKKELQKKKNVYIFIDDNININELENFQSIDMFINTACSRIEAPNIINVEDI